MGIFDALTSAVSGLQAQSFALQNISGNIANSQTVGYKETDTSFANLVSAAALNEQTSGGVFASSVETNGVQGTIQNETVATDMAINGDGMFTVAQPTSFSDNLPNFDGVADYTRRGDFQVNSNGYLVNGSGYYLMGIPVDAATGNPLGSVPQVLQFNNNFVGAQETTTINYEANLPSGTAQLDPNNFASNPVFGAQIEGTGATLNADGPAVLTGTHTGSPTITANTTMSDLGVTAGQTFTVSDGTNQTTYTAQSGDTVQSLLNAINAGSAAVTASVSNGQIVLTSNGTNADTTKITMVNNAADDTADAALGFTPGGSAQPVNLVTQGLGGTFTITQTPVGGSATQYSFTIGTGAGDLQTMAQVQNFLSGLNADGITGSIDSSGNITLTAQNSDTLAVTGTGGLSPTSFGIQDPTATPNTGNITANDESTFTAESIDGGSVTAYDSKGDPVNVDLRWAKVASSTGSATWQLYYQTNTTATGTQTAWANAGSTFTFGSNGQLTAINGQTSNLSSISIANLSVNGDSLGSVQVNFGAGSTNASSGLTEFASSSTSAQITQLQQNGFAAGQLQSISVDNQNRVVGTFSNGLTIPLAEITLAHFNGVDQLQALNGGAYSATPESGQPIYSATGTITGSALEASNVDIATQFSQLIVAQQAYSANARVMTTADQMIQSLLTVIQ